jgi:NADPH2 dehydrogenase
MQLAHAGRKASCTLGWEAQRQIPVEEGGWQVVGPSAVPFGPDWTVPEELDEAGMRRIEQAFVDAALRADRCGFDVLEIHAAHGYLLNSFLSPLGNFRTDRYGGSREARMAYPMEVLRAVRRVWPKDKGLGIRLNATELDERGLNVDDAVRIARELKLAGVDYVTMSAGNAVPGRTYPPLVPGYQVEFANRVRNEAAVATMAVGMILEPRQAEAILQEGRADLIAIARGFLDNPRWAWHAANELGEGNVYPKPMTRARPERWPGYALLHKEAAAIS